PLVEGAVEGRAAVPRSAEGDSLRLHRWIGDLRVVRGDELRYVEQLGGLGRLACPGTDVHDSPLSVFYRTRSTDRMLAAMRKSLLPLALAASTAAAQSDAPPRVHIVATGGTIASTNYYS